MSPGRMAAGGGGFMMPHGMMMGMAAGGRGGMMPLPLPIPMGMQPMSMQQQQQPSFGRYPGGNGQRSPRSYGGGYGGGGGSGYSRGDGEFSASRVVGSDVCGRLRICRLLVLLFTCPPLLTCLSPPLQRGTRRAAALPPCARLRGWERAAAVAAMRAAATTPLPCRRR